MKNEIRDFCFANCADERKSGETDEQFVYKTRKKAIGPFKRRMWELGASEKGPIIEAIVLPQAYRPGSGVPSLSSTRPDSSHTTPPLVPRSESTT